MNSQRNIKFGKDSKKFFFYFLCAGETKFAHLIENNSIEANV